MKKEALLKCTSFFDMAEERELIPRPFTWTTDFSNHLFLEEEYLHAGVLKTLDKESAEEDKEYYILMQTALVKCRGLKIHLSDINKKGSIRAVLWLRNPRIERIVSPGKEYLN